MNRLLSELEDDHGGDVIAAAARQTAEHLNMGGLRALLVSEGLPTGGKKQELAARYRDRAGEAGAGGSSSGDMHLDDQDEDVVVDDDLSEGEGEGEEEEDQQESDDDESGDEEEMSDEGGEEEEEEEEEAKTMRAMMSRVG